MDSGKIQDLLAEFENRIGTLELSMPNSPREVPGEPRELTISLTDRQMDIVNQLKAQVLHLQNKLNEHIDPDKKIRLDKYERYEV